MTGIRIRDLTEGFLAFDLIELLEILGDSAVASSWRCSVEECISADNARPNLEDAYNAEERLTGMHLFALARETRQVIDGTFEAFRPGEDTAWITLSAIDSSYWEVFTADWFQLSRFESRFRDVERIEERTA